MWRRILVLTLIAIVGKIIFDEQQAIVRVQHAGGDWTPAQQQALRQRMTAVDANPTRAGDDTPLEDF